MFKLSKKRALELCQIYSNYSKSTTKTPEWHLVLLLLTLSIFQFILMLLLNSNKKMLVGSGKLIVSDNFFSKLWEIRCPMGWDILLGYRFSSLLSQNKVAKDNFSHKGFKKISQTLYGVWLSYQLSRMISINHASTRLISLKLAKYRCMYFICYIFYFV